MSSAISSKPSISFSMTLQYVYIYIVGTQQIFVDSLLFKGLLFL